MFDVAELYLKYHFLGLNGFSVFLNVQVSFKLFSLIYPLKGFSVCKKPTSVAESKMWYKEENWI